MGGGSRNICCQSEISTEIEIKHSETLWQFDKVMLCLLNLITKIKLVFVYPFFHFIFLIIPFYGILPKKWQRVAY